MTLAIGDTLDLLFDTFMGFSFISRCSSTRCYRVTETPDYFGTWLSFRIGLGSATGPSWATLGKPFLFLPYFHHLGIMMSFQLKLENITTVRTYKVVIRFETGKQTLSISADLMKFSAFPHKSCFCHIPVEQAATTLRL